MNFDIFNNHEVAGYNNYKILEYIYQWNGPHNQKDCPVMHLRAIHNLVTETKFILLYKCDNPW